jgi:thiol-disulfide isomerase/thioredoxin
MSKIELQLYYASWCGHCKVFKPTWEIIQKELPKEKKLDDIKLSFYDCEDTFIENDLKAKDVEKSGIHIKSYPTLILKIDTEYHVYPPVDRTYDTIKQFILCKLNKASDKECDIFKAESQQKGGNTNYRNKYKKYKELYHDLLIKYHELKNKK